MNTLIMMQTPAKIAEVSKVYMMNKRQKQAVAQAAFVRRENKLKITRKVHVSGNSLDGF